MKVPFSRYESSKEAHSNVSDVLDHENIDQVALLEKEFGSYIGAKFVHATSHGTAALHLAMLSLELKRGDKVVCSVNAHPSIPESVRHFDAEPVFIDIDPDSFNINLDKLEVFLQEHEAKKLKAVIVSHIAGQCVDLDRLYKMAKLYDVKIVEDASEALGATYNGKKIGATGADIVCFNFSTHLKKDICSGGMIVTATEELIERARLLSNHGMTKEKDSLDYIYDIVNIGFDYSMSQLDAAYIRAQFSYIDKNIATIQKIAQKYNAALDGVKHITLPISSFSAHHYGLYIVKVDKNRDSFAGELKAQGVEVGLHYIPLHFLSYYKNKYALKINNFPVALTVYQQIMSLPLYPSMSDAEVDFVIAKIKSVAEGRV